MNIVGCEFPASTAGGNNLSLSAQSMEPINHFLPVVIITAHRPLHQLDTAREMT